MSPAISTLVNRFMIMRPMKDGDPWSISSFTKEGCCREILHMDKNSLDKFIYGVYYKPQTFVKDEWLDLLFSQPLEDWGILKKVTICADRLYELSLDYSGSFRFYECNDCGWSHRCICYGTFEKTASV